MSAFARRHYELVATALRNIHPGNVITDIDFDARLEMWTDVRESLCQTFAGDNERFDRTKFIIASLPENVLAVGSY